MRRKVLRDFVIGVLLLFVLPLAELSVAIAQESVFTVQQPDFQKSPYTGMTRQHWIQAGEYLLKGAFGYIHTLDDQMYFPKQLDKTYPNNDGQVPVAKLEGLARTLFIAAPLLKDNPELVMNLSLIHIYTYPGNDGMKRLTFEGQQAQPNQGLRLYFPLEDSGLG